MSLFLSLSIRWGWRYEEGSFLGEMEGNYQIPRLDWNPQWPQLYCGIRGAEADTICSESPANTHCSESPDQHDSSFKGGEGGIVRELTAPYSSGSIDQCCFPLPPACHPGRPGWGAVLLFTAYEDQIGKSSPSLIICKYIQIILALPSSNMHFWIIMG